MNLGAKKRYGSEFLFFISLARLLNHGTKLAQAEGKLNILKRFAVQQVGLSCLHV